ncbi:MAG TPA: LysE family translocator [Thermoanaerobaculia bacterium]|nr:LysE family translocator [Thermoanaerobaculia bacterium]
MTWSTWLLFALTEILLCLTPGPAVLFVLSHGLTQGRRASLWANAGILSANGFYFCLSALGLGAVLLRSHRVFLAVQYAGALYLVYLGVQTIRGAGLSPLRESAERTETRGWRTLTRGFALQAANPKALLFFVALLPQFLSLRQAIVPQMVVLGLTSEVIEFLVLASYGYLAGRAAEVARRPRFVTLTNRVSGGMLIAAGTGIALASRR